MRRFLRRHRGKALLGVLGIVSVVTLAWLAAPFLTPSLDARSPRVPSTVWSRPQTLDPDLPIRRDEVLAMLRRRGYVESSSTTLVEGRYLRNGRELVVRRRAFSRGDRDVAAETITLAFDETGLLRGVRNGRGAKVASADLEPELLGRLYGKYWHDRTPIALADFPAPLVTAVLEIEDRRFHEHGGLDFRRIGGAALVNLRAGRTVQGGSTITQQLVKNLWLTSDRTWSRKLKEAYYAVGLERRESKEEILEAYLNEVYLGQRGPVAVHGMGQGAYHYFGKSTQDLTLGECAFLAGLIQAPGRHSPHRSVEHAIGRRDVVLKVLLSRGRITQEEHDRAIAETMQVRPEPRFEQPAPFVTALVRRALEPRHAAATLESEGLSVHTTVDARLQRLAAEAVDRHLAELERRSPRLVRPGQPLQAAVVVLTPHSGEVLALVGGRSFRQSQFDRATLGRRQPGSTFKPVVALAALGADAVQPRVTLATKLEDAPLALKTEDGTWAPVNWDRKFRGDVTVREALALSLNVPMVRLSERVGRRRVIETARRLGIESPLDDVPSLPLGSNEVTLLEMTQAYAVFASEGLYSKPTAIHAVRTAAGRLAAFDAQDAEMRFTPEETFLVTSALESAARKPMREHGWTGPVAGKTGTTDKARDLWFVGYTPDLVVGVWVGYDDAAPTGLGSAGAAAPIAAAIFSAALGDGYDRAFVAPDGVLRVDVNPKTGERAGLGCRGDPEWFLRGTEPVERCGLFDSLRGLF